MIMMPRMLREPRAGCFRSFLVVIGGRWESCDSKYLVHGLRSFQYSQKACPSKKCKHVECNNTNSVYYHTYPSVACLIVYYIDMLRELDRERAHKDIIRPLSSRSQVLGDSFMFLTNVFNSIHHR